MKFYQIMAVEKWCVQHVTNTGQRKNLSDWQELNLWTSVHTEIGRSNHWATKDSGRGGPYTRFFPYWEFFLQERINQLTFTRSFRTANAKSSICFDGFNNHLHHSLSRLLTWFSLACRSILYPNQTNQQIWGFLGWFFWRHVSFYNNLFYFTLWIL